MKQLKTLLLEKLKINGNTTEEDTELAIGSHVIDSFGKRFSFIGDSSTSYGEVVSTDTMQNEPIKPVQTELLEFCNVKRRHDISKIAYFAKWLDNLPFDKFDNLIATKFTGINKYGKEVSEIEKYIMDCAIKDNIFTSPDKVTIGFNIPDKYAPDEISVTAGLNNGRPYRIILKYNIR
jgi:hypothetical protein